MQLTVRLSSLLGSRTRNKKKEQKSRNSPLKMVSEQCHSAKVQFSFMLNHHVTKFQVKRKQNLKCEIILFFPSYSFVFSSVPRTLSAFHSPWDDTLINSGGKKEARARQNFPSTENWKQHTKMKKTRESFPAQQRAAWQAFFSASLSFFLSFSPCSFTLYFLYFLLSLSAQAQRKCVVSCVDVCAWIEPRRKKGPHHQFSLETRRGNKNAESGQ